MLTTSQYQTLGASIKANPLFWNPSLKGGLGDQILGDIEIADFYNGLTNPAYWLWNSKTSTSDIFDAIVWGNLTPAMPTSDLTTVYANKALLCQGKQFNLQTILSGRETINATKANVRSGLQDALTGLPSKADGTNQAAGWTTVQDVLKRQAREVEKVFASGSGTFASPSITTFEGAITPFDIPIAIYGA